MSLSPALLALLGAFVLLLLVVLAGVQRIKVAGPN